MGKILVTGGAGFIGSHTVVELLERGYTPIIIDNLSNSQEGVIDRIELICGKRPQFVKGDIREKSHLETIFTENSIDAVIHFAGHKAVGESVANPLKYYSNNVVGSLQLFEAMTEASCKKIIFSSSCTVYGKPKVVPISENAMVSATNPYGESKLMVENVLHDLSKADGEWQASLLRYFNPAGAHASGLIGEDPQGIPNNLLPYISQVSVGKLDRLSVFGGDYDTIDGTGVRDYIHVTDLAQAHVTALQALDSQRSCNTYNIGTGRGHSVLEVIQAFESASGQKIPYDIKARRAGDIDCTYSDASKIEKELGWVAKNNLDKMMTDLWNWQSKNPHGYSLT